MELTLTPYLSTLLKAGLSSNEAELYLYVLEHGKASIQTLLKQTGHKRGNLYHLLYALRDKGLLSQTDEKKKLHFEANDPTALRPLIEQQRILAQESQQELENILPSLTSTYTLTSHKPGVALFEGEPAIRHILSDSLLTNGEILQVIDSEAVEKYVADIDAEYVSKRLKAGIKKRLLIPDSAANRLYALEQSKPYQALTEIRLLSGPMPSFKTSWLIYEHKISYLTLQPGRIIGAVLEDPLITSMHRGLFELLWTSSVSV